MLTADTDARERIQAEREFAMAIERAHQGLGHLDRSVARVRRRLSRREDPFSLERMLESRARAGHHADRARALLADGEVGQALPHALYLVEEIREGIAAHSIFEEIGAMMAEAEPGMTRRALDMLEARVVALAEQAGQLHELVMTSLQDSSQGVTQMASPNTPDSAAEAVRDLGEILAGALGGPAAAARTVGRRYDAVADQLAASLDAYGLPHDGVQLPAGDDEGEVRSRLIDGLQRNFAYRDEDGTRTYYRTSPQPIVRDPAEDKLLLRGAALVNANMLRAEADGVLAILDRLPDMLRFAPASNLEALNARAAVHEALEQLVATARDPLGINVARADFQYRRLDAAVIELLRRGMILSAHAVQRLKEMNDTGASWEALAASGSAFASELRVDSGAIRNEEVYYEVISLAGLMASLHHRVTNPIPNAQRGLAGARLEELLTAAYDAANALDDDLSRFGTSPLEQTVETIDPEAGGAAPAVRLSISQFIGWTQALCAPFARAENRTAGMSLDEVAILAQELGQLAGWAGTLARLPSGTLGVSLPGVRRQVSELAMFLADAAAQAGEFARPAATASAPPPPPPPRSPPAPPRPPIGKK